MTTPTAQRPAQEPALLASIKPGGPEAAVLITSENIAAYQHALHQWLTACEQAVSMKEQAVARAQEDARGATAAWSEAMRAADTAAAEVREDHDEWLTALRKNLQQKTEAVETLRNWTLPPPKRSERPMPGNMWGLTRSQDTAQREHDHAVEACHAAEREAADLLKQEEVSEQKEMQEARRQMTYQSEMRQQRALAQAHAARDALERAEDMVDRIDFAVRMVDTYAEALPTFLLTLEQRRDLTARSGRTSEQRLAHALAIVNPPLRLLNEAIQVWDGRRWRAGSQQSAVVALRQWVEREHPLERISQEYTLLLARNEIPPYEVCPVFEDQVGFSEETALAALARRDGRLLAALRAEPAIQAHVEVGEEGNVMSADAPGYMNTPGGLYALRDGARLDEREARRRGMVRLAGVTPADTADETTCPTFLRELAWALPDPEVRDWLQVALGYVLTGENTSDITLWLLGKGANGKTSLTGGVVAALGEYAAIEESSAMLRGKPNFPALMALRGKRLVRFSEMDKRYTFDPARLKMLTNRLQKNREGKVAWTSQFTMLFETNVVPRFEDDTVGFTRRMCVVPFNRTVTHIDTSIRPQIEREAAGILRWLMEGAVRYYLHPEVIEHRMPAAIQQATKAVLAADNPVKHFYDSLVEAAEPTPFAELYERLATMCRLAGKPLPAKQTVSGTLRDKGFKVQEGHARKLLVWATTPSADEH